jgi:hypothetical protein
MTVLHGAWTRPRDTQHHARGGCVIKVEPFHIQSICGLNEDQDRVTRSMQLSGGSAITIQSLFSPHVYHATHDRSLDDNKYGVLHVSRIC